MVCGSLHDLAALAQRHAIEAPALLIIEEVVGFAETLHWFGQKPLAEEQRLAA